MSDSTDSTTQTGPEIVTFGCRLNTYESEVMRNHVRSAGLDGVVIVNTCAVTSEAERQARQTIRKLRRELPDARIVVTGCAAQIDPQRFAAMPPGRGCIGCLVQRTVRSSASSSSNRAA